ncbi:MAG: YciI family protein [Prevotella sp.]|nr:YciI family protein [Prevotella sp.]
MQFVITAYDGAGMLEKRMKVRQLHLEGMERLKEHLVAAGGLLDEEGKLKGSVLIMEFQNREELDQYLSGEIYVKEHVWERITVERMNAVYAQGERVGK